jgi:hypothetical protein
VFTRFTQPGPIRRATAPLPTSLTVPCHGSGRVVFVPTPLDARAKSVTVTLRFAGNP